MLKSVTDIQAMLNKGPEMIQNILPYATANNDKCLGVLRALDKITGNVDSFIIW